MKKMQALTERFDRIANIPRYGINRKIAVDFEKIEFLNWFELNVRGVAELAEYHWTIGDLERYEGLCDVLKGLNFGALVTARFAIGIGTWDGFEKAFYRFAEIEEFIDEDGWIAPMDADEIIRIGKA